MCSLLRLEREQIVSNFCASILTSFTEAILPTHFRISSIGREDLVKYETSNCKLPLSKPFTVCTTVCTLFVVDIVGTFMLHRMTTVMEILSSVPNDLITTWKENDIAVVNRGFCDVKTHTEAMGYKVHTHHLKGKKVSIVSWGSQFSKTGKSKLCSWSNSWDN